MNDEAWLDPDPDPDTFRRIGYRVIDAIADYYAQLRDVPVFAGKRSADVAASFDEPLPEMGGELETLLDAWSERILPSATHIGSPRYFGFVNGSGTPASVLADALAASINMNVGGWKASPPATEIERRTIAWIVEMLGLGDGWGGLFVSGGQMANFTALLTALRNTASYDTTKSGLQDERRTGRYLVYMSAHEGHVSILRAADMLNLGRDAVQLVPDHPDFRMDVEALERMIVEDRARGDIPFCVVGQVGSINVGIVDDLDAIADVCARHGLWFHADGACGAVGAVLPELSEQYRGLDRADSVTLDPHKWLYVSYECGCVLVRDPERLRRSFSMTASYLRGTLPTEYAGYDYFDVGPQMSRGFRALKVWMSLKHYGVHGYRRLMRQNVLCARRMHELVTEADDFQALHTPVLYIYSFRYCPAGVDDDAYLDELNQKLTDALQLSGIAFMMSTRLRGRTVLRISVCSHRTTPADVETVFLELRRLGRSLHESSLSTPTSAA